MIFSLGTHGIHNLQAVSTTNMMIDEQSVIIAAAYSEHSCAAGALLILILMNNDESVDFTKSTFLALDRNVSLGYMLPFDLYPGKYKVFAYDIESDGTLASGVGYPAVNRELVISNTTGGTFNQ
jgi:hypothetical protein